MQYRLDRLQFLYMLALAMAVVLGVMVRATPGTGHLPGFYPAQTVGYDASWPNCGGKAPAGATWGVVGVTGGLSFHPNKCLQQEVMWFKTLSVYVNTGYPGSDRAAAYSGTPLQCISRSDAQCLAYNYGYNAGLYAVHYARQQNVHATWWWLDVETENSWDDDPLVNRASLQGTADAITNNVLFAHLGYYAYPGQWKLLTANWRGGNLPSWAATGTTSAKAAIKACKTRSFTGGPLLLTQYIATFDRNYVCPQK